MTSVSYAKLERELRRGATVGVPCGLNGEWRYFRLATFIELGDVYWFGTGFHKGEEICFGGKVSDLARMIAKGEAIFSPATAHAQTCAAE